MTENPDEVIFVWFIYQFTEMEAATKQQIIVTFQQQKNTFVTELEMYFH